MVGSFSAGSRSSAKGSGRHQTVLDDEASSYSRLCICSKINSLTPNCSHRSSQEPAPSQVMERTGGSLGAAEDWQASVDLDLSSMVLFSYKTRKKKCEPVVGCQVKHAYDHYLECCTREQMEEKASSTFYIYKSRILIQEENYKRKKVGGRNGSS